VKWSFYSSVIDDNTVELTVEARIDKGWHLYSQKIPAGGPIATSFSFTKNPDYSISGKVLEKGKAIEKFDNQFEMKLKWFENRVKFVQVIKTKKKKGRVVGKVEFMVCDDERCLPPSDQELSFIWEHKDDASGSTEKPEDDKAESTASNDQKKEDEKPKKEETKEDKPPKEEVAETKEDKPEKVEEDKQEEEPDQASIIPQGGGIEKPVKWGMYVKQVAPDEYDLYFKAKIEKGWHLYSQDNDENSGPIPTSFSFNPNDALEIVGKATEPKAPVKKFDPNFDVEVKWFSDKAEFIQRVKALSSDDATLEGSLEYMACDDSKCLPPTKVPFSFPYLRQYPENATFDTSLVTIVEIPEDDQGGSQGAGVPCDGVEALEGATGGEITEARSIWGIFIAGFLGGLLALLTPCVFPMIPLTVSFFTKRSEKRSKGIADAFTYAFSIMGIYTALGLLVTVLAGPSALNALSTSIPFNLAFFVIFVIFAFSFFGYYELTLPSSFVNRISSGSGQGGLLGIFFMAFTLSLVSFSCTGPIIGTLLVEASVGGNLLGPAVGMFAFSLALAIPFALFALFPSWLNSLPKSGGWMTTVKGVLGFIELALAIKFLSNADLVAQWGLLKRETFLAIWLIIAVAMGLYLLGAFRFPHDEKVTKRGVGRIATAIASFAFALYLIPGFKCQPLSLLSGFPPPDFYSYSCSGHCPHDLNCFHDYKQGLEYAAEQGKPVMIDFTGWACVNCRKMEENVWIDDQILQRLRNEYVLISLYVDEKQSLPSTEQYVSQTTQQKVETVGDKWSDFQTSHFCTNTQPYYVLIDHDGKTLNTPRGYTPKVQEYLKFLEEGINEFNRRVAVQNGEDTGAQTSMLNR